MVGRDRFGDWTPEARAARKQAHPKPRIMGRWVRLAPGGTSPRGDLRRTIAATLTERGLRLSGRQKVRARKAMRSEAW